MCYIIDQGFASTCRLVALVRPLLVEVKREQEVGVPPGVLVVRGAAAPPLCQSGVQKVCRPLGVGRTELRLVLQLKLKSRKIIIIKFLI